MPEEQHEAGSGTPPENGSTGQPGADDVRAAAGPVGDETAPDIRELVEEIRRDPVKAARHVKELRAEAASRRRQAEAAQTERETEARERQASEASLMALRPRAERADVVEAYLGQAVRARVDALAPIFRPLVPQYDDPLKTLQWLDANAALLTTPRAPTTDAGARGDGAAGGRSVGSAEHVQAVRQRYRIGR